MSQEPITISLSIGYTDNKNLRHTSVTFGKRINGAVVFAIDDNPQSDIPTQYSDMLMQASITEFGSLPIPVPLQVLLSLDSFDREELIRGHNAFTVLRDAEGKPLEPQYLSDSLLQLAVGYEAHGLTYDWVEFGRAITGNDEVEADRAKLTGIRRICFLAGKQVSRLYQSQGAAEISGPLNLNIFEKLDIVDLNAIRLAAEVWRHSFRRIREAVQQHSANSAAAGGDDRVVGSRDPQPVN